uniref:ABC transporter ATP-binding protein n=1 Tax=Mediterraneibacter gnavus TaxID=33038 RepID=UPI0040252CDE
MLNAFKLIWNFSTKRKKEYRNAIIFSFLEGLFLMAKMFAVIIAIYALFGRYPLSNAVIAVLALTVLYIAGVFIFSYKMQLTSMSAGFGMVGDKRFEFGEILKNAYLGFFDNFSVGRINSVLTTTLSEIETSAPSALIRVVGGVLGTVSLLIGLFFYEWRIALISLLGMAAYLLVVNWQIRVSRRDAPKRSEAQSKLSAAALLFLQGIKVTKAFSFKNGDRRLKDAIQGSCNENIALSSGSIPSQIAAGVVLSIFETAIIFTSVFGYTEFDIYSVEKCLVLIILSFMAFSSMNQAGSVLSMIGILDSALRETNSLTQMEQIQVASPEQHIASDEIIFEDVSFSYGNNEVLSHIDTAIKAGSFTAIIGPSGSGKTTLCQLIPRFFDVKKGRILIGGADIRHIPTEELMSKISVVFQKVYLFEDTIFNNIRFGKPTATLEEVRTAAKAARCDDFIMALPEGYDTLVQEGGNNLSGGEKQRISIARAILKDAPIIILDETTSALDTENEHEVLAAIEELTENKTVIMIAHRIKTVEKADHIIAIENGRIVQEGTHEELLHKAGIYADFIHARERASGWKLSN